MRSNGGREVLLQKSENLVDLVHDAMPLPALLPNTNDGVEARLTPHRAELRQVVDLAAQHSGNVSVVAKLAEAQGRHGKNQGLAEIGSDTL